MWMWETVHRHQLCGEPKRSFHINYLQGQSQPELNGVAGTVSHWRPLKSMVARVRSILGDPEMKRGGQTLRAEGRGGGGVCTRVSPG